jgi:hypothetical protein
MIRADGGSGDYQELVPPMLGIWNTLLNGSSDATWVCTWQFACQGLVSHKLAILTSLTATTDS